MLKFLERITGSRQIIDSGSNCYIVAKKGVQTVQKGGKGGTLLVASQCEEQGGDSHVTFAPFRTPEQVRRNPFLATEPTGPGKCSVVEYDNIGNYQQIHGAQRVEVLRIGPTDDFERVLRQGACRLTLASWGKKFVPALQDTIADLIELNKRE